MSCHLQLSSPLHGQQLQEMYLPSRNMHNNGPCRFGTVFISKLSPFNSYIMYFRLCKHTTVLTITTTRGYCCTLRVHVRSANPPSSDCGLLFVRHTRFENYLSTAFGLSSLYIYFSLTFTWKDTVNGTESNGHQFCEKTVRNIKIQIMCRQFYSWPWTSHQITNEPIICLAVVARTTERRTTEIYALKHIIQVGIHFVTEL